MTRITTSNALLKIALTHHRERRLTEAATRYRQVLEIDPHHPIALSMLGMILMNESNHTEAESLFKRHLEVAPDDPLTLHNLGQLFHCKNNDHEAITLFRRACSLKSDFAPIFNDLAVSLHRLGQWDAALVEINQALKIDPNFAVAFDNLGVILYDCRRFNEATQAHLAALTHMPTHAISERASILCHLVKAAYEAKEFAMAELACKRLLDIDANAPHATEYLAKTFYRLNRPNEALALLNQRARNRGLATEERPNNPEATILVIGGVGASHVPTRYLFDPTLFTTLSLSLLSPDQADAPLGDITYDELDQVDIVFNTLGETEKNGGQIQSLKLLLTQLGKPVLNPPDTITLTGRDQVHPLFGNIPGLTVPTVRWAMRDELINSPTFKTPFLIRPSGTHGGEDLALIKQPDDLTKYLVKTPYDCFLLTDFYDFKGEQNHYRKYRFIFIDRKPFPCHLAIADNWLVHYWRAEMGRTEWKKQEEQNFLNNWRQVFGPKASTAIETVAHRMNLDYGGLDCSLLPNGEILFFEANACMLVHLDEAKADFPYKHLSVPQIRNAMTHLVREKILKTL